MRTLLRGGRVLDPGGAVAEALECDADRVVWTGTAAAASERRARAHVVDLDGAVVTPAFVDAHVHATATGLLLDGLDLRGVDSEPELLDAVAARAAARPGALIWGHGWEESVREGCRVPPRAALDRAAAGAPVYLSRVDVHSALASSGLLDRATGVVHAAGFGDGALTAAAHHLVRRAALAAIDSSTRDDAQRAFLDTAARHGVGVVHECAGPEISGIADLRALRGHGAARGAEVIGYWGEAVHDATAARDLSAATGAHGLAGDLFVDGSLGSRTAALRAPYTDAHDCTGNRYLDAAAVGAHLRACTEAGIQAGFHVIGDAAADAVLQGLTAAGPGPVRHRVEHLEMVDPAQVAVLAAHGVIASVQPAFDAAWGGPHGMYAARLGWERAARMNPLALLVAAGVTCAFGSDSPVTPVDPWGTLRAAVRHRTPGSGIDPLTALAAHTVGGYRAAADPDPLAGRLVPGAPASYAVWDGAGVLDGDPHGPRCLRTVVRGRVLHDVGVHGG